MQFFSGKRFVIFTNQLSCIDSIQNTQECHMGSHNKVLKNNIAYNNT